MKYSVSLLLILTMFGCGSKKKEVKSSSKEMGKVINDTWKLVKMLDKDAKNIQIEFNTKENKFYGTDGCNNISGTITKLEDNTIELGEAMGTRMACEDMDTPAQYHRLLKEVREYKIEDLNLYLFDANKKILLTFKR